MEIVRAKVLGYCMGVRRAVDAAERALEQGGGRPVYTLGPLIHNPEVLHGLERRGLGVLAAESVEAVDAGAVVLVRAHGTTPQVLAALERRGVRVVDATCPRVHLSQRRAREWGGKGYTVIIAGDRNHGEVVSICGYAGGRACVIQSRAEAEALDVPARAVLIAQTTFSPEEFDAISGVVLRKNPAARVFNSICPATMERQQALRDVAGRVDGILVVGGKNSANTRRLYETARSLCPDAALIEDAAEIPPRFRGLRAVGLTAGASTPDAAIARVEQALRGGCP